MFKFLPQYYNIFVLQYYQFISYFCKQQKVLKTVKCTYFLNKSLRTATSFLHDLPRMICQMRTLDDLTYRLIGWQLKLQFLPQYGLQAVQPASKNIYSIQECSGEIVMSASLIFKCFAKNASDYFNRRLQNF